MQITHKIKGSILIMVLWMIMLGLILVTAIASNIRLSAITVIHQQEALQDWGAILDALNKAHMELVIDKMPKVKVEKTSLYNRDDEEYRFDGRPISLTYPAHENIVVRIYDLSGKINIAKLRQDKLTKLLEQKLGENHKDIPHLVDAWFDWLDKDDLKRLNGAEKDYYKKQKLDYEPRNGKFASVNEILQIKGFAELFSDTALDTVFTLLGSSSGMINPNIAAKETFLMLPGMDEALADKLIAARKKQHFKSMADVNVHLNPIAAAKLRGWFNFRGSNYYAIVVYPKNAEEEGKTGQTIYVYMEEVEVNNRLKKPVVLRVVPYANIVID